MSQSIKINVSYGLVQTGGASFLANPTAAKFQQVQVFNSEHLVTTNKGLLRIWKSYLEPGASLRPIAWRQSSTSLQVVYRELHYPQALTYQTIYPQSYRIAPFRNAIWCGLHQKKELTVPALFKDVDELTNKLTNQVKARAARKFKEERE